MPRPRALDERLATDAFHLAQVIELKVVLHSPWPPYPSRSLCVSFLTDHNIGHPLSCSLVIIEPLLNAKQRALPAWISWKAHVELVTLTVQHQLTIADVQMLDQLVVKHSELFDQVSTHAAIARHASSVRV